MNKLTLLGTGTNMIEKDRMASSVLIEHDETKIIFDMGRGVTQRLLDVNLKQDDIEHIIISHFHPDHISDLIPYIHAGLWSRIDPRSVDLNIYGPKGIKEKVQDQIIDQFIPSFHKKNTFDVITHEIDEQGFEINGLEIRVRILQPANNHAIKFKMGNTVITLTGDFDFHENVIRFLLDTNFAVIDAGHSTEDQIALLASGSQVGTIIMGHLYDQIDPLKINRKAKGRGYKGELILGEDLMSFEF